MYLPKDWRTWGADTPAHVIIDDDDGDDGKFDRLEEGAAEGGYASTIDAQTLEDLVRGVRDVLKADSFDARLEALIYYQRFDAFLPSLGAPDPPPWEETRQRLDREFYDSLGPERPGVPCRSGECGRGAVRLSALCKVHHFEQAQGRACPFTD